MWAALVSLGLCGSATASSLHLGSRGSPVVRWSKHIEGPPNNQLPDAPTLGNGYTGLMISDGHLPGSIDLWLNT